MVRKIITVTVFLLLLSACCEKEGSFLNTVIKNHAAKVAALAQQETISNPEPSTLSANAAVMPAENTQTALNNQKQNSIKVFNSAPNSSDIENNTSSEQKQNSIKSVSNTNQVTEKENLTADTTDEVTESFNEVLETVNDVIEAKHTTENKQPSIHAVEEIQETEIIAKIPAKTEEAVKDIETDAVNSLAEKLSSQEDQAIKSTVITKTPSQTKEPATDIEIDAVLPIAEIPSTQEDETTKSTAIAKAQTKVKEPSTDLENEVVTTIDEILPVQNDEATQSTVIAKAPTLEKEHTSDLEIDVVTPIAEILPAQEDEIVQPSTKEIHSIAPIFENKEPRYSESNMQTGNSEPELPQKSLNTNKADEKIPAVEESKNLSELTALLEAEDNTAIELIIEQTTSQDEVESAQSESERNRELLELLSKDIKQQPDKTSSKIDRESLELLNDILSD